MQTVVPMIHVQDVRATAEWYRLLGFKVERYNEEDGQMNWALLSFGNSEIMLNAGGRPSGERRREVDLYVYSNAIDDLLGSIEGRVEVVEGLHNTFYGMREFTIRDNNGFWITFGQPNAHI